MRTSLETDADQLLGVFGRHAQNPSAFLALNDGNEFFTTPGVDGVVAFPHGDGCGPPSCLWRSRGSCRPTSRDDATGSAAGGAG